MLDELTTETPCLACGGALTPDDNYRCRNSQAKPQPSPTMHTDCRELRRVLTNNFLGGDDVPARGVQQAWAAVHERCLGSDSIDSRPYRRARFLALSIERRLKVEPGETGDVPWLPAAPSSSRH